VTRWEAIEGSFTRLRDFALTDIEGFAGNRTGGNYGLVGLVVAACDALGGRCYGGDSGTSSFGVAFRTNGSLFPTSSMTPSATD
jgi:hypothetical protein